MKIATFTLAVAASLSTTPAFAQDGTAQPDTTAPNSPRDESSARDFLLLRQRDDIVVTATRSGDAIPVADVPASVTLLDAPALEQRQTRIVSDILRDVPGVAVNRAGGIGGLTQVRIRGSESNHVLVLVDGIEVADPYQGEFDFSSLLADPSARIEVLRGQQSALYGSDAIGGVIHYITATGREAPGFSVRGEGGTFGTASGAARAAGVAGDLEYAVTGSYYHTDGQPTARGGTRDIGSDSIGTSAKLTWSPSDLFRITAVARYSHVDADTNNSESDPGSPRFGLIVDSPGVHSVTEAYYGLLRAEGRSADERFRIALTGQLSDSSRNAYSNGTDLDFGDRGWRYKASLESSYRFGSDRISHRITAAVDLEREEYRNTTPFAFNGVRATDNLGVVGQYELNVADRFQLGGSVRHDQNDRFGDPTTYRVQGAYRFGTYTRVRAAYGTGIKNPGFFELFGYFDGQYIGNPNLQPEESEGWEVGIDQGIGNGLGSIGATYFDSTLNNEIYTTYPAPDFVATPANRTTQSTQRGIELFGQLRPMRQLRIDVAYTYLDAKENGVEEVRRPRHLASLNVTGSTLDERLTGTLTVRYNGDMTDVAYITPDFSPTTVDLDSFVLVNLAAEYRVTNNIALFARAENLLDERYEEVFSYVGAGRSVVGGARLRF